MLRTTVGFLKTKRIKVCRRQYLQQHQQKRATTEERLAPSLIFPQLVVFDLDACFWDQEMFEMTCMPTITVRENLNGRGQGVAIVMSDAPIRLHAGSLKALQDHADKRFPGTKVAFASSATTPFAEKVGRATLKLLEVLPGLTVWDLIVGRDWEGIDVNQIGRQSPLSDNKARSQFPRLKRLTGIRYDHMLFFDDCNWGDHCSMVASRCREDDNNLGPVTIRTPNGLSVQKWEEGLQAYHERALQLGASAD